MTNAQKLLWAGQKLHPNAPLYNMAFAFEIFGEIDTETFQKAFAVVISQVDAFRTTIGETAGNPFQLVHAEISYELQTADLSHEGDPSSAFLAWATEACRKILPIDKIMFDAGLTRLGRSRWGFYLNQHHIVSDAASATQIFHRLSSAYQAASSSTSNELTDGSSFADYVDFEAAQSQISRSVEHWRSYRQTHGEMPALYGERATPGSTDNFRVETPIGAERMAGIRALATSGNYRALTPDLAIFRILVTAVFAYTARVSEARRITIGALSHNRGDRRFAKSVGLFAEMLPLGVRVDESDAFHDLFAKVRTETDQFLRAVGPGAGDASLLRSANIVFNMIRSHMGAFGGNPVRTTWLHSGHVDESHHLRIHAHDYDGDGDLTLSFDFNATVFSRESAQAAIGDFMRLLDSMLRDDATPIFAPALADAKSVRASQQTGDSPSTDYFSIVDRIISNARRAPDKVAIEDQGRVLTYGEIVAHASALAMKLERGQRVAVCLPRSADAVMAMLAAQIAGAVFVPVDPTWPDERIRFVIEDSDCVAAFGLDGANLPVRIISLETQPLHSTEPPAIRYQSPDELAYILYTSGSTGKPKGVAIENRALGNYIGWATGFYDCGRGLSFPLFTKLTFDLTITSIFTPLVSGGRIVVYPEIAGSADLAVNDVFADDRVDIVKLTPAHLALVADMDLGRSRISQLILGGEELLTPLARRIHERSKGRIAIHNEYGPTEATVGCILHTFDAQKDRDAAVPIGRPISGMTALVLDRHLNPVPRGVTGDLWLAGESLASAYVNQPEVTSERFVALPACDGMRAYKTGDKARLREDDVFEYFGRDDAQVKLRGHRIELGEIEAAIADDPAISGVAVKLVRRNAQAGSAAEIHCARCGLSSTYPGVSFDDVGVCDQCAAFDRYADRAQVYFRSMPELEEVFAEARARKDIDYDCVALLSGGKDSTYMLSRLVDMGLRVLAWTLDNGFISPEAKANILRVTTHLGVDHVFGETPAMNEIFVDSLNRHANVCNGCFKTIYTLATELAARRGIPFIVTGLSRGQFFETRLTEDLFTKMTVSVEKIDDSVLAARKAYHRVDDAVSRLMDTSVFANEDIFERVKYVDFYRYCDVELDELMAYLDKRVPWLRPTDTGRSTNCLINDAGIYVHKKRRGFHNYALPYSWDVRMGHKKRAAALDELDDDIDEANVRRILHEFGFAGDIEELEPPPVLAAFFVAPADFDAAALRERLRHQLPDVMIPARLIRVDELPLTQNGKIDREALLLPGATRDELAVAYEAPATRAEEILCRIWSEVLKVDRVGIADDFYELGGDSITAIQIIARAQREGVSLSLAALLESRTVRRLLEQPAFSAHERKRHVGPTSMTPAQHWLFAEESKPQSFLNLIDATAPDGVTEDALRSCLMLLVEHHDALRMSFEQRAKDWRATTNAGGRLPEIKVFPGDSQNDALPHDVIDWLSAPFDLTQAPLLRTLLVQYADGASRLFLSAHHLIIDAVSWSILLDDLDIAYTALLANREASLSNCTTDLQGWGETLREQAAQSGELRFWANIVSSEAQELLQTGGAPHDGAAPVVFTLPLPESSKLTTGAHAWRIGVDEIIGAALVTSLFDPDASKPVRFFIEGHGRESTRDGVDVTRTMGWLTSRFPVLVDLRAADTPIEVATATKDAFRAARRGGAGFGALAYLENSESAENLRNFNQSAHLLFNYYGRSVAGDGEFRPRRPIELVRAKGSGGFALEVSAIIVDDRLHVEFQSPRGIFSPQAIDEIISRFAENLRKLIRAFEAADAAPVSAGDFPLSGLDRESLGDLAALLGSGSEN